MVMFITGIVLGFILIYGCTHDTWFPWRKVKTQKDNIEAQETKQCLGCKKDLDLADRYCRFCGVGPQ